MSTTIARALAAHVQVCEPAEDAAAHRWSPGPIVWADDPPDVSWWCCLRCAAQVRFDPERMANGPTFPPGWPDDPAVVFPASCFAKDAGCTCPRATDGTLTHLPGCAEIDPATVRQPAHGLWHNPLYPCGVDGGTELCRNPLTLEELARVMRAHGGGAPER